MQEGLGLLFAVILVSAVPSAAAFAWFRLARYPFPAPQFLLSLFAGATSVFAALILQGFLAGILPPVTDRATLLAEIFVRIALAEELGRLLLLIPLFMAFRRFGLWKASPEAIGKASGLAAGLGFGLLESAIYGAADPGLALLRAFTATLLHAACGARVGLSIAVCRARPALAIFQFASAVVIHGIYNLLIVTPGGFMPWLAVFVAASALASSAQAIARGMRGEGGS